MFGIFKKNMEVARRGLHHKPFIEAIALDLLNFFRPLLAV